MRWKVCFDSCSVKIPAVLGLADPLPLLVLPESEEVDAA
jgi:hypothetical protein